MEQEEKNGFVRLVMNFHDESDRVDAFRKGTIEQQEYFKENLASGINELLHLQKVLDETRI